VPVSEPVSAGTVPVGSVIVQAVGVPVGSRFASLFAIAATMPRAKPVASARQAASADFFV